METSIKIKKFWYADIASDGGAGTNWQEIQQGQREATVQLNGSDANTTNYKNVIGGTLESDSQKGDMTMNFQLADLTPEIIADFIGGTVTEDADSIKYTAPENLNAAIEKSIMFLTSKNVLWIMPRVKFDGYPIINDDDLHHFQMNSTVLQPEKEGERMFSYEILKIVTAKEITAFSFTEQTGPATITAATFTVDIEVVNGTALTALSPTVVVSKGASIQPPSNKAADFSSAVIYTVMAADGSTQAWTVNVTVAV